MLSRYAKELFRLRPKASFISSLFLTVLLPQTAMAQEGDSAGNPSPAYTKEVRPLLKRFCFECHANDLTEAETDLEPFRTVEDIRKDLDTWLKVRAILNSGQMPPKEAEQPDDAQRATLRNWVNNFLRREATANAGDPGPTLMRRLNNEEYNYVVRDLTGVESLNPTREFPVDGAAGEGFINSGEAQAMSPSLVTKYLDAAREVASHAVLTPDGVKFSPHVTRRDWTDERVAAIQQFYDRFTEPSDVPMEVGGTGRVPNEGGAIPLAEYFAAAAEENERLLSGNTSIAAVAERRSLNAKYLDSLWQMLSNHGDTSLLLQQVRERWRAVVHSESDADRDKTIEELTQFVAGRQNELFKYNVVGHIGRDGKSQPWLDSQDPVTARREFRISLPDDSKNDVTIYLAATDAEGTAGSGELDCVLWRNPRLVAENKPDIPLSKVEQLQWHMQSDERMLLLKTADYLAAFAELQKDGGEVTAEAIGKTADRYALNVDVLNTWASLLGVGPPQLLVVSGLFEKTEIHGDYDFIRSWGTGATPSIGANSSDQEVRIPGIAKPHSVFAHPSPTLFVAAGWKSPVDGDVRVKASIADAHPDCGDGQEWFLQHRTARRLANLWDGKFGKAGSASMDARTIRVRRGELISFLLGPGTNYYCDLTELNLTITEVEGEKREWNLAADVSPDILAANPHADRFGNADVWHFYKGEMKSVRATADGPARVPVGSLLEAWMMEKDQAQKQAMAEKIGALVNNDPPTETDSADAELYRLIHEIVSSVRNIDVLLTDATVDGRFGRHPLQTATGAENRADKVGESDLILRTRELAEFRIAPSLAAGRTFVADAVLCSRGGKEGAVRAEASLTAINAGNIGVNSPVLVNEVSAARKRILSAFADFRRLFPAQLCYRRIVPVDEVVTLTLFYRQDDDLQRLMLNDDEVRELNRMWDELLFVAQEPLKYEVAFEQIREFATQDRPDLVTIWDPLKPSVIARADRFRERLVETEPQQVESVLQFAARAWRRPLRPEEGANLRDLYCTLRESDLSHDESIRLLITRVLTSPTFLYRRETPGTGNAPQPIAAHELASRLSFFLWSSTPDNALTDAALNGSLADPATLQQHARRMLKHPRARRLAEQFACQWLHLRNFDQNDDKNEKLYPEFRDLRDDMYEETVRFFADMFRNDGSILDMLSADHTFLNEELARHYGIQSVAGDEWRRVENIREESRGGLLGMATVLASQSGASRTSPILRGNWIYETLLGERLPRPPADVPQLPEELPTGLTARQMIEKHSSDEACSKCHRLIDPYGFALEQFDAIGRRRMNEVDASTTLIDGHKINGVDGLRDYLLTVRRDDIVRQFCRKLLGFSLGRELILSDEVVVEGMLKQLKANDFRFGTAVDVIIGSRQFTHIRSDE